MNKILKNFKLVFSRNSYLLLAIFLFVILYTTFSFITNEELLLGNYGIIYYCIHRISEFLISALFAIFMPLSIYKYLTFSSFNLKENSTSTIGAFFGIIAAGCPACSITLASYIGLASLLTLFPYDGLELKVISVPLLIYANYSLLSTLHECKLKR